MTGRIVVTDSTQLLAPGIARIRDAGVDLEVLPEGASVEEAVAAVADADAAIVGLLPFGAAAMTSLRRTGLLVRAGIGYDIFDIDAATRAGVWVANVPDYCVDEVADHTLLLLLAAWRRLPTLSDAWRHGRWLAYDRLPPVSRVRGRRLGVVGLGRIGSAVTARARGFGWAVLGYDPVLGEQGIRSAGAEPVADLDELFAACDAVTLHAPVSAATAHMVDERRLSLVRPGFVLVNTSRGGLVSLDALDRAIVEGRVTAAGLDVVEGEPEPDLSHPVFGRAEVIVTGHVAWYSQEARRDLALLAADEALRFVRGERPRNLINPEARSR